MFGIEKNLGRVMGPVGLLAAGAISVLLAVPAVRKGARRLAVSTIAGALTLGDGIKKVTVDARDEMSRLTTEAKGELDKLVDEAKVYGNQAVVPLAAVPAAATETITAARADAPAAMKTAQPPAKKVRLNKNTATPAVKNAKATPDRTATEARGPRKSAPRAKKAGTKILDRPNEKKGL